MIAGIIPGNYGAVAVIAPDGRLVRTSDLPIRQAIGVAGRRWHLDEDKLAEMLDESAAEYVVVERPDTPPTPKKALALGVQIGVVVGIAASLGIEQQRYWRTKWREDLSIPVGYMAAISRVNDLTKRHWPGFEFPLSQQGHLQQLAALLALYGCQLSHGEPQAMAA